MSSSTWDWSNQSIVWNIDSRSQDIDGIGSHYRLVYNATQNAYKIVDSSGDARSNFICEYQGLYRTFRIEKIKFIFLQNDVIQIILVKIMPNVISMLDANFASVHQVIQEQFVINKSMNVYLRPVNTEEFVSII